MNKTCEIKAKKIIKKNNDLIAVFLRRKNTLGKLRMFFMNFLEVANKEYKEPLLALNDTTIEAISLIERVIEKLQNDNIIKYKSIANQFTPSEILGTSDARAVWNVCYKEQRFENFKDFYKKILLKENKYAYVYTHITVNEYKHTHEIEVLDYIHTKIEAKKIKATKEIKPPTTKQIEPPQNNENNNFDYIWD